jgi:hypothetical protein
MLAVELPAAGMSEIAASTSPLRELLASANAAGLQVTHDQVRPLPIGGTPVTWTAWDGAPGQSTVRVTRTAYIYVFPFGQAPVGVSGDDHATAGNHSPKIARDGSGKLHMVWLDGGRAGIGFRVLYRRAARDPQTGAITWETEALRVSDPGSEAWNSYAGIEATDSAVHIAWYGAGTTRYRRAVRRGDQWIFEAIRDTRAAGGGDDYGPAMATRGDNDIHLVTPSGRYAVSTDGGAHWTLDQVPVPANTALKSPALALDDLGNVHVVFTSKVRSASSFSSKAPNNGYWELRYVRREPGGKWVDAQNVLAPFAQWADQRNGWDILADWSDIVVDAGGHIHVAWHGTAKSHIFGNDEAYYLRRAANGPGVWGPWEPPQALHPVNPARGEYFSFAPALSTDVLSGLTLALVFFDTDAGGRYLFDTDAVLLRNGLVEGAPVPLSRMARAGAAARSPREGLSAWFPTTMRRLSREPDGRAWLDVLTALVPPEHHHSPVYVIYQRREVTDLAQRVRSLAPSR